MRAYVFRVRFGMVAVAAAMMVAGCGKDSPTTPTPTPTGPTFSTQIQAQILNPACVSCHTDEGRTPASGLNLRSGAAFANLVGVPSIGKPGAIRVIAGNPGNSYLVQKLEGASDIVGLRMPRNGPPFLTAEQVALIRLWIQNGAPNN
jgi:mono/diheme cytochrome c family protein